MDDLNAWRLLAREHRGITQELAGFVVSLPRRTLPAATREVLLKAVVDALGCGLHGLSLPWAQTMRGFAAELGGPPEASLWGGGERVGIGHAVLAAGTAVHAFDFDDHSRAKIHPGAVVVPLALALAEREHASGELLIAAIAAGYEVMNRISQGANPGRARMRGWHLTGTCGSFAAAATASVLLGLDADTTASAFGLAGTQSAGLWAFTADAAMSKRMHPGSAAQAGLTAALLAQRGFAGPRLILEAADGSFLFAMSDTPRPARVVEGLGTLWHSEATCFKPHACCGSNHACVDAVVGLMAEHHLRPGDVRRVVAGIPSVVQAQTGFDYRADSVLNAQMSLRYNLAVAMHDGQALLAQFTPQRIVEPALVRLAESIEIVVDAELDRLYPELYGGRVTLHTHDGRVLDRRVDHSRGMPENPMSDAEVDRKFMSLAGHAVGAAHAAEVLACARGLFEADAVQPLNALMGAARPQLVHETDEKVTTT